MLDIFNRKKLAAVTAERDTARELAELHASQRDNLWEAWKAADAELTAIKEKQRENSRKGALAANAKRRAEREKANG